MSVQTIAPDQTQSTTSRIEASWWLIGCVSGSMLTEAAIDAPSFVVGRRAECNLRLRSQRVSGRHAEFLMVSNTIFVRDLNSTNGTFVNRRQIKTPTPIASGDHVQIADVEFRIEHRRPDPLAQETEVLEQKKTTPVVDGIQSDWVMSQLEDLIRQKAIIPYYQPIVRLSDHQTIGFEALARSSMPGLESPKAMFETAETVDREVPLSIVCRERAIARAPVGKEPLPIFVNTHPHESVESDIIPTVLRLQRDHPEIPVVIEFHEKSIQSSKLMLEHKARLADMGVRTAYDDFGSGQSRLLELVQCPPDYLKFDASLTRGVHQANPYHRRMLRMLIETAHEFGIASVAEGIEYEEEAEAVKELGFQMAQGYYFGCPHPNPKVGHLPRPQPTADTVKS